MAAAEPPSSTPEPEHAYKAARAFADKGDLDRAALLLEELLHAYPTYLPAWLEILRIALTTGQYRATHMLAMGLLERDASLAPAWLALGLSLEHNSLSEAIEAIRRALTEDDSLPLAHFHLARLLGKNEEFGEAIRHAEHALAQTPQDADVLLLAGRLYQDIGAHFEASQRWSQAIEVEPQRPDAYLSLADLLVEEGRFRVAFETLIEAQRCCGPSLAITGREVAVYALVGEEQKAIMAAKRLTKRLPHAPEAHLQLGTLLLQAGKLFEAEEALRQAYVLDPKQWQSSHLLGKLYESSGLVPQAEEAFREALRADPLRWEVHNDLGLLLLGAERFEEAMERFSEAVTLAPDGVTAPFFNMALTAYKVGAIEELLRLCKVLNAMPGLPTDQRKAVEEMLAQIKKL